MAMNHAQQPRLAVVGGGISGLIAARELASSYAVTLFEANDYIGGHTHTVEVADGDRRLAIDTGFIVFNERTYPNFCRLLNELKVASQPTSMSFSVHCEETGLEYRGADLGGLFAQKRNLARPAFWRLLRDVLRFNREAVELLATDNDTLTVGCFLEERGYSPWFREKYFLPMGAAVWSCPPEKFREFPIRFIAEFYHNHGLLQVRNRPVWRVVQGGSWEYVQRLLAELPAEVRPSTPIAEVRRIPGAVVVRPELGSAEVFDHVVFACHSDQALRLLSEPTPLERELLRAFPYQRNTAVLHTDTRLLPQRRRAWASWNYRLRGGAAREEQPAIVTYNMNILQGIQSRETYCVTLNDDDSPEPARVLRHLVYHHPVFTTGRAAAQRRHRELIDHHQVSYCGAYWRNGFHEDGVVSAQAVARVLLARAHGITTPNSAVTAPRLQTMQPTSSE